MESVFSNTYYVDFTFNSLSQFLFISLRENDIHILDILQCKFLEKQNS